MLKRFSGLLVGAVMLVLLLPAGLTGAASVSPNPSLPPFNAKNFHHPTRIDNPYLPLVPGTVFTYRNTKQGQTQQDVVTVTSDTRSILGITCVAVKDVVTVKGELLEDTVDWYAQDDAGNVWYMGEDTSEYKNGVVVSKAGSWQAGVNGAQPGYVMEAHPGVGDYYYQEYYPGEAEDAAQVLSLNASLTSAWPGPYLETQETSALEPTVVEQKYYAPGVGMVKSDTVRGGSAESILLSVTHN